MDYTTILDPIPWEAVGHSVIQTWSLYWLLFIGVKLVGRRVFGEMGPQDMVILLLVTEACDLGLTVEESGYWATVFSVLTILITGAIGERIPSLRRLMEAKEVVLFSEGRLDKGAMKKYMIEEQNLHQVAHEYGLAHYQEFQRMILEGDGSISGIFHSNRPTPRRKIKSTPGS